MKTAPRPRRARPPSVANTRAPSYLVVYDYRCLLFSSLSPARIRQLQHSQGHLRRSVLQFSGVSKARQWQTPREIEYRTMAIHRARFSRRSSKIAYDSAGPRPFATCDRLRLAPCWRHCLGVVGFKPRVEITTLCLRFCLLFSEVGSLASRR
jgi:hypothetical protein